MTLEGVEQLLVQYGWYMYLTASGAVHAKKRDGRTVRTRYIKSLRLLNTVNAAMIVHCLHRAAGV